jgi:metal transporter CNNM
MACCLCFSALFSGLTLGVLGLDLTGLEIIMEGDDPKSAAYARKIYPIRKRGNLLLCTLLLGNTAVNSLLSILLAGYAGGIVGFFASTLSILLLGEIIPQAICSRHGLMIGSYAVPVVKVIMIAFFPVAYPISWILDRCLGKEITTTYSSSELKKLLQIHVAENKMDPETANTMTGALKYKEMLVQDVMTPLKNTFMIDSSEKLNFETIARIFKAGYSRIPVYEINPVRILAPYPMQRNQLYGSNHFIYFFRPLQNNVIGLLFVKDLIFIDPEDETRVSDFVDIFGRGVHVVWPDDKLGDVLRELRQGRSHMALVRGVNNDDETQDPFYEIRGIITLEDIIEEILGTEIVDETDAFLDGSHAVKLDREDALKFARLRLLDSKIVDERLTLDETKAVTAHLWKNHSSVVSLLTENQLQRLVAETPVSILPTATQKIGEALPADLLYQKGVSSDVCTLILAGKVCVLVGQDQFRSDVSSWSLLGAGALKDPDYAPDFSAYVSDGPCRCLRFTRSRFVAAIDASVFERQSASHHAESNLSASAHYSYDTIMSSDHSNGHSNDKLLVNDTPPAAAALEASRKKKLLTALRAVTSTRETIEDKGPADGAQSSRPVAFSEPGQSVLHSASDRSDSQQTQPIQQQKQKSPSYVAEETSARFEFISGGAGGDPSALSRDVHDSGEKTK